MQTTIIITFALVLMGSFLLSLFASRAKPTIQSFFWGDRRLPPQLTASLILTSSFSLNGLLYQAWLGYLIGWWSLVIQLVWCLSFVMLAANVQRFQDVLGQGTMHGIIGARFGDAAGRVAALASVLGFAVLIGWEVVVTTTLLGNVAGFDRSLASSLPAVLALLGAGYTALGGVRGNARVNAVQNVIKSFVLIVAAGFLIFALPTGGLFAAPSSHQSLPSAWIAMGGIALTANLAFSMFWQVVDMSNWQNLSATRADGHSGRKSVVAAGVLVFLFPGLIGTLIGIAISGLPLDPASITDSNILNRFAEAVATHQWLTIALFAAFAATMLSTMDGYALAASQAATWDLTNKKEVQELLADGENRLADTRDDNVMRSARIFVFVVAAAGAIGVGQLVAQGVVQLFDLVYLVVIAQMSLVGPILICLFSKSGAIFRSPKLGWLPIIVALVVGYAAIVAGKTTPQEWLYTFAPVLTILLSVFLAASIDRNARA